MTGDKEHGSHGIQENNGQTAANLRETAANNVSKQKVALIREVRLAAECDNM